MRGGHRDEERRPRVGQAYLKKADEWQKERRVDDGHQDRAVQPSQYYLRVTKNGKPDSGDMMQVSDGGPLTDERNVVDPSFLDLVRLGVSGPTTR